MAVKPMNTEKPKFGIETFLPVLITFGPALMFIGLYPGLITAVKRPDWLAFGMAAAGALMLMSGLALLRIKQYRLEQRLDELERLRN